jgi:hypothetical protein
VPETSASIYVQLAGRIYTVGIYDTIDRRGSVSQRLERDTPVGRILKEDTSVDLALVQIGRLVTGVGDIGSSSRLLEYAELELATSSDVDRLVGCNSLQLSGADRIVN